MTALKAWVRALDNTKTAFGKTLPGLIEDLADTFADRVSLLSRDESLSYRDLARRTNRYARWAIGQGLGSGDVVCLLMPNRPDYVAIWLGLTRIGCTVALINTHLRGDALLHSIQIAQARMLIIAVDLPESFVPPVQQLWDWSSLRIDADRYSSDPIPEIALPRADDRALLIYTSGTTGFPKATIITHRRIVEWSFWFAGMMNTQPDDRLYNCLPMYHSVGGVVAVGAMLVKGGSVFIREQFSASQFWNDITQANCTIFQYIGELCRYLTLTERHPRERDHRLRLACGNGLQGEVWREFQQRFAIPQILEFYAATEGTLSLYNCEGRPGAIGRVPPFLAHRFSAAIIQCNLETLEPLRGPDGRCIPCPVNEPGEAISPIDHGRQFDGYTDPAASGKKILRDVFNPGDRWFRSGDIMSKDAGGYYYFIDRLGDTFRWKGENVSTTEVASVLRTCIGILDAVVYGVPVPGNEGRTGMAAISTDANFTFAELARHLEDHLPAYARPMFVRLCASLDVTGTFKLTKTDLARQGYSKSPDPVWRRDQQTGVFTPLSVPPGSVAATPVKPPVVIRPRK